MNILTDEEINQLKDSNFTLDRYGEVFNFNKFARAVESAVLSKLAAHDVEPVAWRFTAPGITKLDSWPHGGKWHGLYTEAQLRAEQQRTAEACARYCAQTLSPSKPIPNDTGRAWIAGTLHCTDGIRNGDWREYL